MTLPALSLAKASKLPNRARLVFAGQPQSWSQAGALAEARKFTAKRGQSLLLAAPEGQILWVGLGEAEDYAAPALAQAVAQATAELAKAGAVHWALELPGQSLPHHPFTPGFISGGPQRPAGLSGGGQAPWAVTVRVAAEAVGMAAYRFGHYKTSPQSRPPVVELVCPAPAKGQAVLEAALREGLAVAGGVAAARDWINHPAEVMHPSRLVEEARLVAQRTVSRFDLIEGEELARQGYGALHAVGRAASHPPALASLYHVPKGGAKMALLALVGKGVTFDSGGLEIKPSSSMALMKKDMGGAATVLGAFQAIAGLGLPLRLLAVVGLAENAVGPGAFRPGDVLATKAGKTVEVTSTDAEGRLVLADAMALALTHQPDWLVDLATLTGAARVALGREVMACFANQGALQHALQAASSATGEPLWPLPLYAPYGRELESPVADLINASKSGFGGAVTAALFLQEFVGETAWAHIDCYAWSDGVDPLYPSGGSGMGVRLLAELARRLAGRD